jgi:MoaA/NifB/PqqE/SkfB family radical SAM enzyme
MKPKVLGLFLTYRCPSLCRICCVNAGPSRKEIMKVEDALLYVRQAASVGVNTISLTGGEPFLCYENMLKVCHYASQLGLEVNVLTNCSWATNESTTMRKLEKLKRSGLSKITINADNFHQEYVPLERVKLCFKTSRKIGLDTELRCIVTKNTERMKYFVEKIGALEEEGVVKNEFPAIPVGRGVGLDRDILLYPPMTSPCPFVLRIMAIEPNGDLAACCGVGGFTPPLIVGNIKKHGLSRLLAMADQEVLYSCLSFYGPGTLLEIIKEKGHKLNVADKHVDRCHVCFDLLSHVENRSAVGEVLKLIDDELSLTKILSEIVNELPPLGQPEKGE